MLATLPSLCFGGTIVAVAGSVIVRWTVVDAYPSHHVLAILLGSLATSLVLFLGCVTTGALAAKVFLAWSAAVLVAGAWTLGSGAGSRATRRRSRRPGHRRDRHSRRSSVPPRRRYAAVDPGDRHRAGLVGLLDSRHRDRAVRRPAHAGPVVVSARRATARLLSLCGVHAPGRRRRRGEPPAVGPGSQPAAPLRRPADVACSVCVRTNTARNGGGDDRSSGSTSPSGRLDVRPAQRLFRLSLVVVHSARQRVWVSRRVYGAHVDGDLALPTAVVVPLGGDPGDGGRLRVQGPDLSDYWLRPWPLPWSARLRSYGVTPALQP